MEKQPALSYPSRKYPTSLHAVLQKVSVLSQQLIEKSKKEYQKLQQNSYQRKLAKQEKKWLQNKRRPHSIYVLWYIHIRNVVHSSVSSAKWTQ